MMKCGYKEKGDSINSEQERKHVSLSKRCANSLFEWENVHKWVTCAVAGIFDIHIYSQNWMPSTDFWEKKMDSGNEAVKNLKKVKIQGKKTTKTKSFILWDF